MKITLLATGFLIALALSGCVYMGPSTAQPQTFTSNTDGTW